MARPGCSEYRHISHFVRGEYFDGEHITIICFTQKDVPIKGLLRKNSTIREASCYMDAPHEWSSGWISDGRIPLRIQFGVQMNLFDSFLARIQKPSAGRSKNLTLQ